VAALTSTADRASSELADALSAFVAELAALRARIDAVEHRLSPSTLRREDRAALERILPAKPGRSARICSLRSKRSHPTTRRLSWCSAPWTRGDSGNYCAGCRPAHRRLHRPRARDGSGRGIVGGAAPLVRSRGPAVYRSRADTDAAFVGFTTNRAPSRSASRWITGSTTAESAILATTDGAASTIRCSPL
jgi:hypothetical protein